MPETPAATAGDVAARLEAAFERVRLRRMQGVPILNPRLEVEVVGLRAHEGAWLGVLVTPWFINLVLLAAAPATQASWSELRPGESVPHAFPAGCFEFLVGEEGDLGRFQMCSLFSPVLEFEDQAAARVAAEAALTALFDASLAADEAEAAAEETGEEEHSAASKQQAGEPRLELSRRGFLSGRMASKEGAA